MKPLIIVKTREIIYRPKEIPLSAHKNLYGNIWESCLDWYRHMATPVSETDPKGPEITSPTSDNKRVRKGGCFISTIRDNFFRSAYRNSGGSGTDFGIRLVCPIGLK